jgi:hypothetical protein
VKINRAQNHMSEEHSRADLRGFRAEWILVTQADIPDFSVCFGTGMLVFSTVVSMPVEIGHLPGDHGSTDVLECRPCFKIAFTTERPNGECWLNLPGHGSVHFLGPE